MTAVAPVTVAKSTDALIQTGGPACAGGGPAGQSGLGVGAGMAASRGTGENFRSRWQAVLKDLETAHGTANLSTRNPDDPETIQNPETAEMAERTTNGAAKASEIRASAPAKQAAAAAPGPEMAGAQTAAGREGTSNSTSTPAAGSGIIHRQGASQRNRTREPLHRKEKMSKPPQAAVPAAVVAPVPGVAVEAPGSPEKPARSGAVLAGLPAMQVAAAGAEADRAIAAAKPGEALRNGQAGDGLSRAGAGQSGDLPANAAPLRPNPIRAAEAPVVHASRPFAPVAQDDSGAPEPAEPVKAIPSEHAWAMDAGKMVARGSSEGSADPAQQPAGTPAVHTGAASPDSTVEAVPGPAAYTAPPNPATGKEPSPPRKTAASGNGQAAAVHEAAGQSGSAGAWVSGTAHVPVGEHGGMNAAPHAESRMGSEGGGAHTHDAFTALDTGPASSEPAWVHAGAQRAEAGFNDPSLGWVGVRASLAGGAVHAAVLPGSAEAAQALSGQIAGLNAHLAAHRIPIDALSMAAPAGHDWGGQGGLGQGNAQPQGQGSNRQDTAGEFEAERRLPAESGPGIPELSAGSERGVAAPGHSIAAGRHISVIV